MHEVMQSEISYLPNGARLLVVPDQRFASVQIKLWYVLPLQADQITAAALLPLVLKRGSTLWPTQRELAEALQDLWGAEIQIDVSKMGNAHLTVLELDLVDPRFLPEQAAAIIDAGTKLLADLIQRPRLVDGAFAPDVFREELQNLRGNQERLKNHRSSYAMDRCLQAVFAGEALGINRLGRPEDLKLLTPQSLNGYYEYFRHAARLTIGITGAIDAAQARESLNHHFVPGAGAVPLSEIQPKAHAVQVQRVREELSGEQSQLILAFSSEIAHQDELSIPLLLVNGLWGGFAHSRLFRKLREEAGLAYSTWSRVDRTQGLIYTTAGISAESAPQAEEIMLRELEALQRGDIGDDELAMSRETIIDQFRQLADDPNAMLEFHFSSELLRRRLSLDEIMAAVQKTTREQIVAAAQKIRPHTMYLLAGNGEEEEAENA